MIDHVINKVEVSSSFPGALLSHHFSILVSKVYTLLIFQKSHSVANYCCDDKLDSGHTRILADLYVLFILQVLENQPSLNSPFTFGKKGEFREWTSIASMYLSFFKSIFIITDRILACSVVESMPGREKSMT